MTRTVAIFGFSGGFLALSPKLRGDTLEAITKQMDLVHRYSPYSYAALVVCGLVMLVLYMRSCSAPQ